MENCIVTQSRLLIKQWSFGFIESSPLTRSKIHEKLFWFHTRVLFSAPEGQLFYWSIMTAVDSINTVEMSCVMVPILVDTNLYSWEKRKYGEVSGSGHAAYTLSIRTRIFPESNFFRGMEYPISGHVIETRRVKTCKRPYFSRFAENHGVPLMNATIFAFHFH